MVPQFGSYPLVLGATACGWGGQKSLSLRTGLGEGSFVQLFQLCGLPSSNPSLFVLPIFCRLLLFSCFTSPFWSLVGSCFSIGTPALFNHTGLTRTLSYARCTTCFLPRNEQKDQLQLKLENEAHSPETLSPASIPWSKHAGLAGVVLLAVRSPHSESCDTEHCNSSVFFLGGRRISKQTCHRCPSAGFGPFFGAAAFFWPVFCLGLYVEDLWRLGWMEASSTPQSKSRWVKKPRF